MRNDKEFWKLRNLYLLTEQYIFVLRWGCYNHFPVNLERTPAKYQVGFLNTKVLPTIMDTLKVLMDKFHENHNRPDYVARKHGSK